MKVFFSAKNNPRVIIIQKLYGKLYNNDSEITFPKHRFKRFIKNVVLGSIERQEVLFEEINQSIENINLKNMDKVFQTIIKSAVYEFLYMPKTPRKIIIKEYLTASNFFLDVSQTKYLNAILDKISKKIRNINE